MMDQDPPEREDAFYSEEDSFFEHLLKMSLDPAWRNELTLQVLQHEDSDRLVEDLRLSDLPELFANRIALTYDPWSLPRWPQFAGAGLTDEQIDSLNPEQALEILNRLRARAGQSPLVPPAEDENGDDFDDWILRNWDKR